MLTIYVNRYVSYLKEDGAEKLLKKVGKIDDTTMYGYNAIVHHHHINLKP